MKCIWLLGFLLWVAPCGAQRPFADVPRDEAVYECLFGWARDTGIPVGYPDGTFGGKRLMTRYEFAVIIARLMPHLEERSKPDWRSKRPTRPLERRDFACLRHAVAVFRPELELLKVDVPKVFAVVDRCEAALFPPPPAPPFFTDAPADHWAYPAVQTMAARGLMIGYPAPSKE